jgi:hypothetical protein
MATKTKTKKKSKGMSRERFIKIASAATLATGAATLGFSGAVKAVEGIVGKGKGAAVTINDPQYPYPFFLVYDPNSNLTVMLVAREDLSFEGAGLLDNSVDVFLPEPLSDDSVFPGLADISRFSGKDLPVFIWANTMNPVLDALFTRPEQFPFFDLGLIALAPYPPPPNEAIVWGVSANVVSQLVKNPRGAATVHGPIWRLDENRVGRLSASVAGPLIEDPVFGLPNQLDPNHLKIKLM